MFLTANLKSDAAALGQWLVLNQGIGHAKQLLKAKLARSECATHDLSISRTSSGARRDPELQVDAMMHARVRMRFEADIRDGVRDGVSWRMLARGWQTLAGVWWWRDGRAR